MQSIDSIETYAYGTSKYLVCEQEEIKCNDISKRYKNGKHKRTYSKLVTNS